MVLSLANTEILYGEFIWTCEDLTSDRVCDFTKPFKRKLMFVVFETKLVPLILCQKMALNKM